MSDVDGRIRAFIVDSLLLGDESRAPAASESLLGSGIIDSTGVLELIEFIEEQFGIHVEETETIPQNLDSVENLVAYVGRKSGK